MKTLLASLLLLTSITAFAAENSCRIFIENKAGVSSYGGSVSNSELRQTLEKKGYEVVDTESEAAIKVSFYISEICYLMEGDVSRFALRLHDLMTADGFVGMKVENLTTNEISGDDKKIHTITSKNILKKIKKLIKNIKDCK